MVGDKEANNEGEEPFSILEKSIVTHYNILEKD